jgi:endonuclease-3 related protein
MTEHSRLASATERLQAVYGMREIPELANTWSMFLYVLLAGPTVGPVTTAVITLLESVALASPQQTSQKTTGQLVELLAPVPRGPQKASLLRLVAEWWLTQFGNDCSPDWSRCPDFYRESLRRIKGLGPATVDELLLFAAKLPVFPINRGTLRVAIRHGWLDLPIDDEEAQSFFVQGLTDANIELTDFAQLVSKVAEAHCGREPKCDGCPLQPLLPPNGPLNPESC